MNVLLAVDDSPDSKAAAHFLQRIQFPAESALYLLHVNPLDEWLRLGTSGRSLRVVEQVSRIRAEAATKMQNVLGHMEETFRSSSLAVHSLITDGSPGAEILRTITEHHIDLVVLGTRGLSKISGFLLGSVSEWVLNEAPCSVLMVREVVPRRSIDAVIFPRGSPLLFTQIRPPRFLSLFMVLRFHQFFSIFHRHLPSSSFYSNSADVCPVLPPCVSSLGHVT